ncbi:MAG: hypothetical protein WAN34_08740 [Acidimicrobiia bacterium]
MSTRFQDLKDLAQMLDEGKVSAVEYEIVKAELLAASSDEWSGSGPTPVESGSNGGNGVATIGVDTPVEKTHSETADEVVPEDETVGWIQGWVDSLAAAPRIYQVAGAATGLTLLVGGWIDPLGWLAAVLGGLALAATQVDRWRWMAWTALAVGLGFGFVGLFNIGAPPPVDTSNLSVASSVPVIEEPPADSLGVSFRDLTDRWNALDAPPMILTGVSITPESGPLDSFVHRFDNNALVAGAYNPDDGYVYALMVRANLGHPAISNMYTHLCYLLYPDTQECFNTYIEESHLFGKDLGDMADVTQDSDWTFEGNEWHLNIDNNVETIRVIAPGGQ